MTRIFVVPATVLSLVAFAATGFADFFETGSGGNIPDASAAGAAGSIDSTISIADSSEIQTTRITINNLQHTWVGDLTATVLHDDGAGNVTSALLFARTGKAASPGPGDASDVNGTYVFADDEVGDWWAVAATAGNKEGDQVESGGFRASDIDGDFVSLATIFGGQSAAGDWTLRITDEDNQEIGTFDSWRIEFVTVPIPEPSSAILFVIASGLTVRRRR